MTMKRFALLTVLLGLTAPLFQVKMRFSFIFGPAPDMAL